MHGQYRQGLSSLTAALEPGGDPVEPGEARMEPGIAPMGPGTNPVDPGAAPMEPGETPVDKGSSASEAPGTLSGSSSSEAMMNSQNRDTYLSRSVR